MTRQLWWGLRGGTGNLGIVTSLTFRLHPVREVYAGNLWYPLDRLGDVLRTFGQWAADAPPALTGADNVRRFPPLPTIPDPLRGRTLVALRGCWSGDVREGAAFVDRARAALGPAVLDSFAVMPPADLGALSMDPVDPLAAANHSELLPDLTDEIVEALVDLFGPTSGSPLAMVEVRGLGGALTGCTGELEPHGALPGQVQPQRHRPDRRPGSRSRRAGTPARVGRPDRPAGHGRHLRQLPGSRRGHRRAHRRRVLAARPTTPCKPLPDGRSGSRLPVQPEHPPFHHTASRSTHQ